MAEETITLPKSGLVLTWMKEWGGYELAILPGVDANLGSSSDGTWDAWIDHNDGDSLRGTQAECLAWLDVVVLELRAAMLPPGAIVVEDSPETVERVAQALMTQDAWNPKTLSELDDSNRSCHQAAAMRFRAEANAVLAALRESRP